MTKVQPPLPPGASLGDLNPDLAFSYEIARLFESRSVTTSLTGEQVEYQEVQVGYTKRPAWFPFVSIHTADTDIGVTMSGAGSHGLRARRLDTEFALVIRDESPDAAHGRARLSDLKYDVIHLLASVAGGGETFRTLRIDKVEMVGITPEDVTEPVPWGFLGQVLAFGTVSFK